MPEGFSATISSAWKYAGEHPVIPLLALIIALASPIISFTTLYYTQLRISKRLDFGVSWVDFVEGTTNIRLQVVFTNPGNRDAAIQSLELRAWGFRMPVSEGTKDAWQFVNAKVMTPLPTIVKPGSLSVIELQSDFGKILFSNSPFCMKSVVPDRLGFITLGMEVITIDASGRRFISNVPVVYHAFKNDASGKPQGGDVWREPRSFNALMEQTITPDYAFAVKDLGFGQPAK